MDHILKGANKDEEMDKKVKIIIVQQTMVNKRHVRPPEVLTVSKGQFLNLSASKKAVEFSDENLKKVKAALGETAKGKKKAGGGDQDQDQDQK